jgi:hypothetical protein
VPEARRRAWRLLFGCLNSTTRLSASGFLTPWLLGSSKEKLLASIRCEC